MNQSLFISLQKYMKYLNLKADTEEDIS